ncbi:putative extensin [Iris pallida]|uniref:Extensin n=1 Tax=Iris pallida TaxID=29817 RepID=A0AAX6HA93_IRIPA|nr:putative extensin [Iris pallida]
MMVVAMAGVGLGWLSSSDEMAKEIGQGEEERRRIDTPVKFTGARPGTAMVAGVSRWWN